jgi:hypothetical protein
MLATAGPPGLALIESDLTAYTFVALSGKDPAASAIDFAESAAEAPGVSARTPRRKKPLLQNERVDGLTSLTPSLSWTAL